MKKIKWILFISILLSISAIFLSDYFIKKLTNNLIYNDLNLIPHKKVGLLLGTSKYLKNGTTNLYFRNRIKATVDLFKAGKIDCIVISGDNSTDNYNEPLDMQNMLIEQGIPQEKIYLDYAGFRTYDSVIRLNKIFGQTDFTVISQEFHNRRAIYIAEKLNLKAIGYNAQDVNTYSGFKTNLREKFARVKVFIDLLVNTQPKFLGEPIRIE